MDSQTGQKKWEFQEYDLTAPAVLDGVVYFGSAVPKFEPSASSIILGKDCLYAVDSQTGTEKWTFRTDYSSGAMLTPSVAGGVVYFQALNGPSAVDAESGRELWDFGGPGMVWRQAAWNSSPVISGGVVYCSSMGIGMEGDHYYVYAVK